MEAIIALFFDPHGRFRFLILLRIAMIDGLDLLLRSKYQSESMEELSRQLLRLNSNEVANEVSVTVNLI